MSSRIIVIANILPHGSAEMHFAEDLHMIEIFAPDISVDSFRTSVLPGRMRRGWAIPDSDVSHLSPHNTVKHRVIVPDHICGRIIPGECFDYLLSNPFRSRYCRHRTMTNLSAPVIDDDQAIKQLELGRRDNAAAISGFQLQSIGEI